MGPAYILGINLSHDSSACLLKDGVVLNAIPIERQTGIKHYNCHMGGDDALLNAVDTLIPKNERGRERCGLVVVEHPCGGAVRYPTVRNLPLRKAKVREAPSHHLAHAYSTFFCSPFKKGVVYVCDTFGSMLSTAYSRESETAFLFPEKKILQRKTRKPGELNIGRFYDFITNIIGFGGGSPMSLGESGKTMALASFGEERPDFPDFSAGYTSKNNISCEDWHDFLLEQGLLCHEIGKKALRRNFPEDIPWGVRLRQMNEPIDQLHRDLAYLAQKTLEDKVLCDLSSLHRRTGMGTLCLAGGTFLNCVLNRKILEETGFKNVFVQPAATDDGNAIGCAMYGYHALSKRTPKRRFSMGMPFFGVTYTQDEAETAILQFLEEFGQPQEKPEPTPGAYAKIAADLAEGKTIGFFMGGAEFGPRALGHRSILADPRRQELKNRLNLIKGREPFRPFAPAVLEEFADEYFHLPKNSRLLTRYMLMAAKAREGKKARIPAVLHIDGTARVQTVTEAQNRGLYEVIKEFRKITGVPLVLNTSLNFKGKPIVETPLGAMKAFADNGLDCLFIRPFLVKKEAKRGALRMRVL